MASKIADNLEAGDILALYGDLGSGKTVFAKGLAHKLGVKEEVTSPTFVIVKKYPIKLQKTKSRKKIARELIHIDCYRIGKIEEAESIGFSEYFQREDAIVVIEWPDRIKSILPRKSKTMKLKFIDGKTRSITPINFAL